MSVVGEQGLPLTAAEIRRLRDEFARLLAESAPEAVWQAFFARNPYALSSTLPVRVEPADLLPLGRPGRSEPDFLIYPSGANSLPVHGLIELKTPGTPIVRRPRKNVLTLSSDVQTAIGQLRVYDQQYDRFAPRPRILTLQSRSHLFVIAGQTAAIGELEAQLLHSSPNLIPPDISILGYDDLLENLERSLPARTIFLTTSRVVDRPAAATADDVATLMRSAGVRMDAQLHRFQSVQFGKLPGFYFRRPGASSAPDHLRDASMAGLPATRFGTKDQFRLYAATDVETALADITAHLSKPGLFARGCRVELPYNHFTVRVRGTLMDLASHPDLLRVMKSSKDLAPTISLASTAEGMGYAGLLYPARRAPLVGRMVVVFDPATLSDIELVGVERLLTWTRPDDL